MVLQCRRLRYVLVPLALLLLAGRLPGAEGPTAKPSIGLLIAPSPAEKLGPETLAVLELARDRIPVSVIRPASGGKFVDRDGRDTSLDRFGVLWVHHGDGTRAVGPLYDLASVEAVRRYVDQGRGLLLSGSAVLLLPGLKLDTPRVEVFTLGNDREQAGLVPVCPEHSALRGLDLDRGTVWMSNAVYPAFASLSLTGNPAAKRLLAKTPGGPANPLVEYSSGKGRAIVLAWQVSPFVREAPRSYRANAERLVQNLLAYLADARQWQLVEGKEAEQAAKTQPRAVHVVQLESLERAITDLIETFRECYPKGPEYLRRLAAIKAAIEKEQANGDAKRRESLARDFEQLRREALLANPLLDFDRLLLVKRGAKNLGLPLNFHSNSSIEKTGYDNQIAVLSPVRPGGKLTTLYRPEKQRFVGDVDLHFDADRLLFSMPGANGCWQVSEIKTDGTGLRELPLVREPDVDNYDACYLPDGRVVFTSTACFVGVPCINGAGHVANLYLLEASGKIRQLTVEQDHDWCPTVLNNGRLLYLRWEYTDIPHGFSRILFHMNPDGTEQMEYYGSNSYWPGSMFFARPVPGHPTKVVAVVGGHHELPRMGDLVIFDPAKGRFEADGAVQRIPGYGRKVEPVLLDLPIAQTWPKFLHPYPLSEKYLLASCKPSDDAPWGIYLVDVFDNLLLLHDEPGYAMLEPIPLKKTPRPPAVPDKVDPARRDAEVFIADLYRGDGLKGAARGTIKSLRVISYQFGYQGMGAEPYSVGLDGPWDPKLILGTVPVCEDGSARFRVPAYTPIAVQPLDAEGKAVQLMRSWFTAMPGEVVSCVGCHEKQNTAPPVQKTIAAGRPPAEIQPWRGPARGFAFRREVQPVLDKHCVGCHDGKPRPDGPALASFVDGEAVPMQANPSTINQASRFSLAYYQLRRFVRTPTKESDMHLLPPWEFHADTTRLVQMLQKGHYDVCLDPESWDRLTTWIDLNAPFHGNWTDIRGAEIGPQVKHQWERRRAMRKLFTGMEDDPEVVYPAARITSQTGTGLGQAVRNREISIKTDSSQGGTRDANEQRGAKPQAAGAITRKSIELGSGVTLDLVLIPAGEFVMGDDQGCADERPVTRVAIREPFWMGCVEVTNRQFAQFDPSHDSRLEHGDFIQFSPGERGWPLNLPDQPVVRVSWNQAAAFCRWLSEKTGRRFALPTEAQWEYACRAGTATPLWYGTLDNDFSPFANVSDATHRSIDPFSWTGRPDAIPAWRPADARFDDHFRVSAPVGTFKPNPWGLFDMHGNVAEWTRSTYRPYPYDDGDGRNAETPEGKKVVRGGSWYDCPARCRSAFRQCYPADRGVYDVGFRVVAVP